MLFGWEAVRTGLVDPVIMDTLVSFFMQVVPGTPVLFVGRTTSKPAPKALSTAPKGRTRRSGDSEAPVWDLSELASEIGL